MPYEVTSIEKTQIQKYKIRGTAGLWADIAIDYAPGRGLIQIASDFGNWSNYWGATGDSFKKFLASIDMHYAAEKFGADRWFDHEATLKLYQDQCGDLIPPETQEQEDYERERQSLEDCNHEQIFIHLVLTDCPTIMSFYDGCPEIVRDVTPGFKNFWNIIWPAFIAQLKSENFE